MRRLSIQLLSSGDSPAKLVIPADIKIKENSNEVHLCMPMATFSLHSEKPTVWKG